MNCVEFEGYNVLLGPPPSWPRGQCGALPIFRHDGRMTSAWKPTAEELEALKNGAHICLTVWGDVHPPVAMHVQKFSEMP